MKQSPGILDRDIRSEGINPRYQAVGGKSVSRLYPGYYGIKRGKGYRRNQLQFG